MTLRLNGSSSGFTELNAPAAAGSNTLTLPTSNGSADQFLKNSGTAGQLEFSDMVEDSSGRLLVGHSSSRDVANVAQPKIQIEGTNVSTSTLSVARNSNDAGGPVLALSKTRGTSTGSSTVVQSGDTAGAIYFAGADGTDVNSYAAWIEAEIDGTPGGNDMPGRLVFSTTADGANTPTERLRITQNGKIQVTGTRAGALQTSDNDTLELFTSATNGAINTGCGLTFYNNDGNGAEIGGTIQVAKENGNVNNTAAYMRFSARANNSNPAEAFRISSGGRVLFGTTSTDMVNNNSGGGCVLDSGGINAAASGENVFNFNRSNGDGTIGSFRSGGSSQGSVSISGSTCSFNGGHLSRWSQLAEGAERTEILRGSVLSNLDEMCVWSHAAVPDVLYTAEDELPDGVEVGDVKTAGRAAYTEDNEQLNRMKVSDVEGDPNVAGVFQCWDDGDDDGFTDDFFCAMTGDFVIRIAQGTTVARGYLLMSAGDGTAKPQDDDIVRSKTIAKVTSTTVSTTYSDGSYCVPCVLMAC